MIPRRAKARLGARAIFTVALLLSTLGDGGAGELGAQTVIGTTDANVFWPVLPRGPVYDIVSGPRGSTGVSTEIATVNEYFNDLGTTQDDRAVVVDQEVWVAKIGVRRALGRTAAAGAAAEAPWSVEATGELVARGSWGGMLDAIIETHHAVTTLPNGGRERRDRFQNLIIVAEEVSPGAAGDDERTDLAVFRDEARVYMEGAALSPWAVASVRATRRSDGGGAGDPRADERERSHWTASFFAGAGAGFYPRMHSIYGSGAAFGAAVGGGAYGRARVSRWLSFVAQADAWAFTTQGAGGWERFLGRSVLWRGTAGPMFHLGPTELRGLTSVQRSPVSYDHPRLSPPAVAIDVNWFFPVPWSAAGETASGDGDRRRHGAWIGFYQDFPPYHVAADFGVTVGYRMTSIYKRVDRAAVSLGGVGR